MNRSPHPTLTRRRLTGAAGAGLAMTLLGSRDTGADIESTPPVVPVETGPPPESVTDVVARLAYDQDAIFAFVRDEIAYEPYAGILRGLQGTLWARAGNSADQAVLLAELFTAAQIPYRFAIGPLSPEQEAGLAALLPATAEQANQRYLNALVAAAAHLSGGTIPTDDEIDLTPAEQAELDRLEVTTRAAADRARSLATLNGATVADALRAANVQVPELAPPTFPTREISQHVWLQVPDGPDWLDADPTFPDAEIAPATKEPATIATELGDDWNHKVTIRVEADVLSGTLLNRRELVTFSASSQQLAGIPIAISAAPAEAMAGLGLTINELFTGQRSVYPVIYAGGEVVNSSQAAVFATEGSTLVDVFGDATPVVGAADGETVALWIAVDIASPDEPVVTVERAIIDRVPPADRASGTIEPSRVAPISTHVTTLEGAEIETIPALEAIYLLDVTTGLVPGVYTQTRGANDSVFGQLGTVGAGIGAMREGMGLDIEGAAGNWSFLAAPSLTMVILEAGAEQDHARFAADMLYRERAVLPLADATPEGDIPPTVLAGALEAAAEQALFEVQVIDPDNPDQVLVPEPSIGSVAEAAVAAGIEFVTVSTEADLVRLALDDGSTVQFAAALASGYLVVAPEQPVEIGGEPAFGWWIVDPATGRIWDRMANGMGFAGTGARGTGRPVAYQTLVERIILWWNSLTAVRKFACVGLTITAIANYVTYILDSLEGFSMKWGASLGKFVGASIGATGACLAAA
jgi:hypothetical protein